MRALYRAAGVDTRSLATSKTRQAAPLFPPFSRLALASSLFVPFPPRWLANLDYSRIFLEFLIPCA